MSDASIFNGMYEIIKIRDRLNLISNGFDGSCVVFSIVSLQLPKLSPSELGFIRAVSWFYVHYFESGKLGTEFLISHAQLASFSPSALKQHRARVQQLRTYCQHNLNFTDDHSQAIQLACEEWFKTVCGTHLPSEDEHWQKLLLSIVSEAQFHFESLERILREIERNAGSSEIVEQWNLRIMRFQAPHKFDKVIEAVVADWGRENFNVVKFRNRYYDRWKKTFENRTDACDFESEARKLVEHALLSEEKNIMPIDGRDLMQIFNIPPSSRLKEVLDIARDIFSAKPCKKEELLELVKEHLVQEKPIVASKLASSNS